MTLITAVRDTEAIVVTYDHLSGDEDGNRYHLREPKVLTRAVFTPAVEADNPADDVMPEHVFDCTIGVAGSRADQQVLRHMQWPAWTGDDEAWLHALFMELRVVLKELDRLDPEDHAMDSLFLVVFKDRLFINDPQGAYNEPEEDFVGIGNAGFTWLGAYIALADSGVARQEAQAMAHDIAATQHVISEDHSTLVLRGKFHTTSED